MTLFNRLNNYNALGAGSKQMIFFVRRRLNLRFSR